MYTSYDYGSAIRETGEIGTPANENDIAGSKFGENKLLGDFLQAVPSLTKTQGVAAPALDQSRRRRRGARAIRTTTRSSSTCAS